MRVKMKISMGSVSQVYVAGKEYDLPDIKAESWISKELAIPVEDQMDFKKRVKKRKVGK